MRVDLLKLVAARAPDEKETSQSSEDTKSLFEQIFGRGFRL
jgi:hypothetical protein